MTSPVERDNWNRHWGDYASSAGANPAQNFRRRLILSSMAFRQPAPAARVLDIGSGQGDMAADVLAACPGSEVLGLELSASGVGIASRKVPRASFLQCDLLQSQRPPSPWKGWATHAVCSEVLEHLDQPELLLANAKPWMAPGCQLIVTVPGGPMSAFDRHIGHRKHYHPEDLRQVLECAGFRIERVNGAGYPFFNLYRRIVIARGSRLIEDVSGRPSWTTRAAMLGFGALFHFNSPSRGWQNIAVATLP